MKYCSSLVIGDIDVTFIMCTYTWQVCYSLHTLHVTETLSSNGTRNEGTPCYLQIYTNYQ
jgi:hypothetical protein